MWTHYQGASHVLEVSDKENVYLFIQIRRYTHTHTHTRTHWWRLLGPDKGSSQAHVPSPGCRSPQLAASLESCPAGHIPYDGLFSCVLLEIHILQYHSMTLSGGAWVAQSVKHLTSAQVMISQFVSSVSSSPVLRSVLTAQSLEPALDSLSLSLSLSLSDHPLLMLCLSKKKKH